MTTALLTLAVLAFVFAGLTRYARHDHFAGPGSIAEAHDELGSHTRDRLVLHH